MEPHPHALGAAPVRAPPLPAHLLQSEVDYSSSTTTGADPRAEGDACRSEPVIWEVKPCTLAMSEMEQELVVSMKEKGHTVWLRSTKTHGLLQRFISETLKKYAEPETRPSHGWFLTLHGAEAGLVGWMFQSYRLLDCIVTAHHIVDEGFVTELSPASIDTIQSRASKAATPYSNVTTGLITKELSAGLDVVNFKRDMCSQKCQKVNCARRHDNEKRRLDANYMPVLCPKRDQACLNQTCSHARNMIELKLHPSLFLTELCPRLSPDGICQNEFPCGGVHPGSPDIFYHHLWEDLFLEGLEKTGIFLAGAIRHCFKLRALPHRPVRILLLTPHIQTARHLQNLTKDLVGMHHLVAAPVGSVSGEVVLGEPAGLLPLLQQDEASLADLAALVLDDANSLLTDPEYASHTISLLRRIASSRQQGAGRLNSVLVADRLNRSTIALAQQLLQSSGFSHRFSMSGLIDDRPNVLWGDSDPLQASHGNTDVIARILLQCGVPSVLSDIKSASFEDAKPNAEEQAFVSPPAASSDSQHRSDSQTSASQAYAKAVENYTNDWARQQADQLSQERSRQNGSYGSDDSSRQTEGRTSSAASHAAPPPAHSSASSHHRETQRGSDHGGQDRKGGKRWRDGEDGRRQEKEGRLREGGVGHAAWQLPGSSPSVSPAQPVPVSTPSRYYSPTAATAAQTSQEQQTAQQQLQLLQHHSQQQLQYNYAQQLQQQYSQQQQQQYLQEVLQREQQQQQQLQYSPAERQLAQQLQYNHAALQLSQQLQSYSPAAALQLQQLHEQQQQQQQMQYSHAALQQQYSQQQQQYILEVLQHQQQQQQLSQASGSQASPSQYGLGSAGRGSHHDHNYKPY